MEIRYILELPDSSRSVDTGRSFLLHYPLFQNPTSFVISHLQISHLSSLALRYKNI